MKMTGIWIAILISAVFKDAFCLHSQDEATGRDNFSLDAGITYGEGLTLTAVRAAVRELLVSNGTIYKGFPVNATGSRTTQLIDFSGTFQVGKSCADIQENQGATQTGIYLIQPPNLVQGPWKVMCDLETDGGSWTVFQIRDDVEPHENFMRNWEDYKIGFGDFDREFWLGNILLWALTNVDEDTEYELAVDLEDWSGNKRFARYLSFRIGSEEDKFRIYYRKLYFGNAGDSLQSHNGLPFSTFDVDNDNRDGDFAERSCARLYRGGWWYGNCHDSNLNGWYLGGAHRSFADGVNWYTWTGYNYSLRKSTMKFRPIRRGPYHVAPDSYIEAHKKTSQKHKHGRSEHLQKYNVEVLMSEANTLTKP